MSSKVIRPSSVDGIKRLAKSIKIKRGTQHSSALDDAARSAGFQNFRHASNALRAREKSEPLRSGHRVFITVYWKDRDAGQDGRETLDIQLTVPWTDLIAPSQLRNHRAFTHFRAESSDHLARWISVQSQSQARRAACAAARTLHFMDATKLQPSKSHSRAFPSGRSINTIPGSDHPSIWYDRETKRYLYADEPYEAAAANKAGERAAWAQRHGFTIAKPNWPGMYNPDGGSRLFLVADATKGILLIPVVVALNKLPTPIVEASWDGESAPTLPWFFSPGSATKSRSDKSEPTKVGNGKVTGPRNSVEYVRTFVGPQRRPKGRMPISAHTEVGLLLKSVLADTYYRKGAYNRVDSIRSELDEWIQREYSSTELPNEQFFELYYHGPDSTFTRSLSMADRNRHRNSLVRVKELLVEHYPDCSPLRLLIGQLDAAVKSLQNWNS